MKKTYIPPTQEEMVVRVKTAMLVTSVPADGQPSDEIPEEDDVEFNAKRHNYWGSSWY